MQGAPKSVWSIAYVSVAAFFPSFKQNFIAYRSSKASPRPDCIFEIHQVWQSSFSRVYSNYCCSSLFERKIINIGQSSHKMYSKNMVNFQESTTILNACTRKVWKLIVWTSYSTESQARFENKETNHYNKDVYVSFHMGLDANTVKRKSRLYIHVCTIFQRLEIKKKVLLLKICLSIGTCGNLTHKKSRRAI